MFLGSIFYITFSFVFVLVGAFFLDLPTAFMQSVQPSTIHRYSIDDALPSVGNEPMPSVLIVPHHLVADQQMREAYAHLAALNQSHERPIQRIILLSPNHFFRGEGSVITSQSDFQTNYGVLESDDDFIQSLTDFHLASLEPEFLEGDHGITVHFPFIERFFPDVQVVPLMMREPMTHSTLQTLAQFLTEHVSDETLVIASIDFSHYLPEFVANIHDEAAIAALYNLDTAFFYEDIDADSPHILTLLTYYLKTRGHQAFTLLSHTNSATLMHRPDEISTTSHIIGTFNAGQKIERQSVVVLLGHDPKDNLLLFKGGDFSFFYAEELLSSSDFSALSQVFDRVVDGRQDRLPPLWFEKNGIRGVFIFDARDLESVVTPSDVVILVGHGPQAFLPDGIDRYWDVERGAAGVIVEENEDQLSIKLCSFDNWSCI